MSRLKRVVAWSASMQGVGTNTILLTSSLECGHLRTDEVGSGSTITVATEMPCPTCDKEDS